MEPQRANYKSVTCGERRQRQPWSRPLSTEGWCEGKTVCRAYLAGEVSLFVKSYTFFLIPRPIYCGHATRIRCTYVPFHQCRTHVTYVEHRISLSCIHFEFILSLFQDDHQGHRIVMTRNLSAQTVFRVGVNGKALGSYRKLAIGRRTLSGDGIHTF